MNGEAGNLVCENQESPSFREGRMSIRSSESGSVSGFSALTTSGIVRGR